MSAILNNAASVKPPVIGVDTIILASSTSSARLQIPADWLKSWLTVEADGCDCWHAFSSSASAAVDETDTTTVTSEAVASHDTGECVSVNDGEKVHYDLSMLEAPPAGGHWFFVHKESDTSAYVRLTRSSGPAKRV